MNIVVVNKSVKYRENKTILCRLFSIIAEKTMNCSMLGVLRGAWRSYTYVPQNYEIKEFPISFSCSDHQNDIKKEGKSMNFDMKDMMA